jgi:rhamnose utilization protein RhaD (predicted bifunctional aldolase and dehydrogenase)
MVKIDEISKDYLEKQSQMQAKIDELESKMKVDSAKVAKADKIFKQKMKQEQTFKQAMQILKEANQRQAQEISRLQGLQTPDFSALIQSLEVDEDAPEKSTATPAHEKEISELKSKLKEAEQKLIL